MQNSPVFLTRMIFEAPVLSISDLNLYPGELLKAQAQGWSEDGMVSLLIKGRVIQALSETQIQPGQELNLMVDEAREGKVYLKLITPEVREQIETRSLLSRLQDIGIAPRIENLPAVMKLVEYQMPVTRQNFEQLTRLTAVMGEVNEKTLNIAAFALSRGLPASKEVLTALLQYVSRDNLAGLVEEILEQINPAGGSRANPEAGILNKDVVQLPRLSNSGYVQTAVAVNSEAVQAEKHPLLQPSGTSNIIESKNIDSASLTRLAPAMPAVSSGEQAAALMKDSFSQPEVVMKGVQILEEILQALQLHPENQGRLSPKIRNVINTQPEIIKSLMLLEEIMKNDPQLRSGMGLQNLADKIEAVEKELAGQKIVNFLSQGSPENPVSTCYFSFPVPAGNKQQLCQLRINYEGTAHDLRQSDRISLVVSLDTEHLGVVLFQATWYREQKLEIQGVVQNDETLYYLKEMTNELVAGLEKLGYRVKNRGIKVAASDDPVFDVKIEPGQPEPQGRPLSIDITV